MSRTIAIAPSQINITSGHQNDAITKNKQIGNSKGLEKYMESSPNKFINKLLIYESSAAESSPDY